MEHDLKLDLELQMDQSQDQSQELRPVLQQSPVIEVPGTEVLRNLIVYSSDKLERSPEDVEKIDPFATELVQRLIDEQFVTLGVTGPNNAGKGGVARGIKKIVEENKELNEWTKSTGKKFDIVTIPYSLSIEAAKLLDPSEALYVPKDYEPANYTPDHLRNGAHYQWEMYQNYVLPQRGREDCVTLSIIESSTPLMIPLDQNYPMVMMGDVDLGMSTITNLAYCKETKGSTFILFVDLTDQRTVVGAYGLRQAVSDLSLSDEIVFKGSDRWILKTHKGKEKDVATLPEDIRTEVRQFLNKTQASPGGISRYSEVLRNFIDELFNDGYIDSNTNKHFFNFLRNALSTKNGSKVEIVDNPFIIEGRVNDLSYFTDSLPVRLHPELMPPKMRKLVLG